MILSFLLTLLAVFHTTSVATDNVYYVVANNSTGCPSVKNVTCESLEYYMNDTEQYFTSNTTFYFMEGVHIIADFQSLLIHQVSNLTLVGQEAKEQGQNDTQHKAVIKCASPTSNILITFSNHITVVNLTITNCGRRWHLSSLLSLQYYLDLDSRGSRISIFALFNVTLGFIETVDVTLGKVSVVDNSGIGLCAVNGFDIVINESIFSHNNYNPITQGCNDLVCNGGNIALLFTDMILLCSHDKLIYSASIVNTAITYGRGGYTGFGAGLYIFMEQVSVYGMKILIDKVRAYNNTGNIAVVTTTQVTHYIITINNLVSGFTETSGGGFFMQTYDVSIKYVHCGYDWLYETNPLRIVNSEFTFNSKKSIVFSYDILDQSRAIDEVKIENIIFSHSFNEEIVVLGRNIQTNFF